MVKKNIYIVALLLLINFIGYSQNNPKHYTLGIMKNLFNDVNINDAGAVCNVWINEINKENKNKYNLEIKIFDNYNEVYNFEKGGELIFLALNIGDYVKYKDKLKLQPEFVASFKGDTKFKYLLLVQKNKNYKSIKDLKNAKIGITTKYDNNIPRFWFDVIFAKNNILNKKKFFNEIITIPDESKLILNLFFGKIDACIVPEKIFDLMAELNPQIEKRLVPLTSSPYFIFSIMCYTDNFSNKTDREYFFKQTLKMHDSPAGKQIMSLMKIDKLVEFHDDDLNSYLELLNEHKIITEREKIFAKENFGK